MLFINVLIFLELTEEEAIAQCVMFLVFGQDTMSIALYFAVYCLALYPEVQDKLRKEVNEYFEKQVRVFLFACSDHV